MSTIDKSLYPTAGQLERDMSQKVRSMYRNQFGHQPGKVECHLLGNKLLISLEDVMTPIEKFLVEGESLHLVEQVRSCIDETIKPKIGELVEEIFKVGVTNCLYDTAISTGCAGAILTLADIPLTRRAKSHSHKIRQSS